MDIRRATQQDLGRIRSLLEESGLPALPSNVPISNVIVALDGSEPVGCIALEVYARTGLLRSAVVSPDRRRTGVGASLVLSVAYPAAGAKVRERADHLAGNLLAGEY